MQRKSFTMTRQTKIPKKHSKHGSLKWLSCLLPFLLKSTSDTIIGKDCLWLRRKVQQQQKKKYDTALLASLRQIWIL